MNTVYILLGANLGEPLEQLEQAKKHIASKIGQIIVVSSMYKSAAWGLEDQPIFYNQIVRVSTPYTAPVCLELCQDIEERLGRIRKEKWGARLIDLDILYYNDAIINTDSLQVPHPYIPDRRFTLVPLVEIAADYIHPILRKTNFELLEHTKDTLQVDKISNKNEISNNKPRNH